MINLTEGAILTMLSPERQQNKDSSFKPVLQVTDIRSVTETSSDWYLMNLSDGTHMHYGMLATERNELVRSQRLQKGSVVRVSLFVSPVIQNHRVIEIIDLEPLLEKCDPIGDPKPLVLNGDASRRVRAKRSNRPKSVVSKEKLAEFAKEEASLQHAEKVEKKAGAAAQQKLIDKREANKQIHEELDFVKADDPASHLASPPTFIKTSPTGVITESENFVESKVLVAEEPEKKKIKIKFKMRSPCRSMEMDQDQQSQAVKKCLHCEITSTVQWRGGPLGPMTLCNVCGVRFKAGRLFPEYRPAACPTFVPTVHSNSHRKVLRMRGTVNGKDGVVGTAAKTYVPCQNDSFPVPAPFPVPDMIIDLEPLLKKCDPIGDPKPLVLNGDTNSRVNAKRSKRAKSVVSKEKLAESAKKEAASLQHTEKVEKKAKKKASLQKVEKKAGEAAQQKLIDVLEANKQLHEELDFVKAGDPASHLASPPTFIKTSPTGVITESENFVESKVLVAEEPEKKKIKIKFKVRSPCCSMEMDQDQQSQAVKKCLHCEITSTVQWRGGPLGPMTLCNACGIRFKAGRLFPEYRPAASTTFVPTLHSNSHRTVLQMRGTVNGAAKTYVPCQNDSVPVPAPDM